MKENVLAAAAEQLSRIPVKDYEGLHRFMMKYEDEIDETLPERLFLKASEYYTKGNEAGVQRCLHNIVAIRECISAGEDWVDYLAKLKEGSSKSIARLEEDKGKLAAHLRDQNLQDESDAWPGHQKSSAVLLSRHSEPLARTVTDQIPHNREGGAVLKGTDTRQNDSQERSKKQFEEDQGTRGRHTSTLAFRYDPFSTNQPTSSGATTVADGGYNLTSNQANRLASHLQPQRDHRDKSDSPRDSFPTTIQYGRTRHDTYAAPLISRDHSNAQQASLTSPFAEQRQTRRSTNPPIFSPAWQGRPVTTARRVSELEDLLKIKALKRHYEDFRCLIGQYEQRKISPERPETVYVQNGVMSRQRPSPLKDAATLQEDVGPRHHQFVNEAAQYVQRAVYPLSTGQQGNSMHEIHAQIRIPTSYGGDDTRHSLVRICNDTGSNVQSVFPHPDLSSLGFSYALYPGITGYGGFHQWNMIQTGNGLLLAYFFVIQTKITDHNGEALTDWFDEQARIQQPTDCPFRLSGSNIRRHLYFATAPGNAKLYVAKEKNGIVEQLPTRAQLAQRGP